METHLGVPIIDREALTSWIGLAPGAGALLLVDKESDWTSFDVVAKCRGMLRVKKIGHTGTLDPMATGLLILCLGSATKLADAIQAERKEYTGTIRLGATTPTDDAESEIDQTFPVEHIDEAMLRQAAARFVGESMQTPPIYSARKVGGERLYKLARRGETSETVAIPPKAITIYEFELTRVELPNVEFRVVCSKGTYVRSIARDLGAAVGSGAHLTSLRRTRSGSFEVTDALTVGQISELLKNRRNEKEHEGLS